REQHLGQLALGGKERRRAGQAQLGGLLLDRGHHPRLAVAEAGLVAEAAEVEPASAVRGEEPRALPAGDLEPARALLRRPGEEEGLAHGSPLAKSKRSGSTLWVKPATA